MELFEFQIQTLQKIKLGLESSTVVILDSELGTGKTTLLSTVKSMVIHGVTYDTINFIGSFEKKYTDYGCVPSDIMSELKRKSRSRSLMASIAKDISSTIGNVLFVNTENVLDNILSRNDEDDMEQIFTLLDHICEKTPILLVFDELAYYDYKS